MAEACDAVPVALAVVLLPPVDVAVAVPAGLVPVAPPIWDTCNTETLEHRHLTLGRCKGGH